MFPCHFSSPNSFHSSFNFESGTLLLSLVFEPISKLLRPLASFVHNVKTKRIYGTALLSALWIYAQSGAPSVRDAFHYLQLAGHRLFTQHLLGWMFFGHLPIFGGFMIARSSEAAVPLEQVGVRVGF